MMSALTRKDLNTEEWFQTDFSFLKTLNGLLRPQKSDWLRSYRANAATAASQMGFPSKKEDLWRRLNLKDLPVTELTLGFQGEPTRQNTNGTLSEKDLCRKGLSGYLAAGPDGSINIFSNDVLKNNIIFCDLKAAEQFAPQILESFLGRLIKPEENKFTCMVAGLAQYGAFLYVPKGVRIDHPLYFSQESVNINQVGLSQTLVILEAGAEITFVRRMSSPQKKGKLLQVGTTEIHLGVGAKCTFVEMIDWGQDVWEISQDKARLARNAELYWLVGSMGGYYKKKHLDIELAGQNSQCTTEAFSLSLEKQRTELDTRTWHLAADTKSNLLLKNVLLNESETIWRGLVHVARKAIRSDGYQSNRNLVLSEGAKVESIPALEILTDDVRCSHGSATGQMDPEELFYLQARGMDEQVAQGLLIEGFLVPVIDDFPEGLVRKEILRLLKKSGINTSI
jgi:Fe-S cluster assembly protein SufD